MPTFRQDRCDLGSRRAYNLITSWLRSDPRRQLIHAMTPAPESPPCDVTMCRKCGVVFSRTLTACPDCGAIRLRRKRRQRSLLERWKLWLENVSDFIQLRKYYFIYIGLGILSGVVVRPVVMFLAEFSMPKDWRYTRALGAEPFSVQQFFEPFVAAAQTLGRWLVQSVVGVATWVYEAVVYLIFSYPSAVVMVVLGSAVGFVMARRRHNKHRSRGRKA